MQKQLIDTITIEQKFSFSATLFFTEAFLLSSKWKQLNAVSNGIVHYIDLMMVVNTPSGWANICVAMTIEELKSMFSTSFGKKEADLFNGIAQNCSEFSFKEYYVHCEKIDLTVFQFTENEIASELNNEYYTKDFLKLAS